MGIFDTRYHQVYIALPCNLSHFFNFEGFANWVLVVEKKYDSENSTRFDLKKDFDNFTVCLWYMLIPEIEFPPSHNALFGKVPNFRFTKYNQLLVFHLWLNF